MKIVCLMENTTENPALRAEHGLSLYIETGQRRILFDAGQSGAFADNADRLGVDLSLADTAVLSHGHNDHGGGLSRFLEINDHAKICARQDVFGAYFNAEGKFIGLPAMLADSGRFFWTEDQADIGDGISLCSCNGKNRPYGTDSAGLTAEKDGRRIPDPFLHEQYMVIHEGEKNVLFSGCSHKGILNLMEWFHPDVVIGGFHFMKKDLSSGKNDFLDEAAAVLNGYDAVYYTCHCTGVPQYQYLRKKMGQKLRYLSAGEEIRI